MQWYDTIQARRILKKFKKWQRTKKLEKQRAKDKT